MILGPLVCQPVFDDESCRGIVSLANAIIPLVEMRPVTPLKCHRIVQTTDADNASARQSGILCKRESGIRCRAKNLSS